jgi:hypothetical protein
MVAPHWPQTMALLDNTIVRNQAMSKLTDGQLERLSILFATGNMSNARKIARLLSNERENERCPKNRDNALSKMLDQFLRGGAAQNWAMKCE